tara:strand:+ start:826 stop:1251 length:426 start_codon:yes stop_codon:yes gene_type:complete
MDTQDEQDRKNKESLDRQRATRERRVEEKRVEDLREEALNRASGTKGRRMVKAADEGELLAMLGRQSQEGNIYDIDTENYNPTSNKEGTDETIANDGIDEFGTGDDFGETVSQEDDDDEFGFYDVLICVNGQPQTVTFLTP